MYSKWSTPDAASVALYETVSDSELCQSFSPSAQECVNATLGPVLSIYKFTGVDQGPAISDVVTALIHTFVLPSAIQVSEPVVSDNVPNSPFTVEQSVDH